MMQNFEAFGKEKIEKLALRTVSASFYCPLSETWASVAKILTLPVMKNSAGEDTVPVFTDEKSCPFPKLFHKSEKFLTSYFYSGRTSALSMDPGSASSEEIKTQELSALIGRLQSDREKIDSKKALNSSRFHLAAHLAIVKEKNTENAISALINLGFYEDAEKLLENVDGEKKLVYLARIMRGKGDIRKAGEAVAGIKDEKLKAQKYIQYAWLLYLSGKITEAAKIFSAFENSDLSQEALYGSALCLMKIDIDGSYESIKEKLKKAADMPGENMLNANAALGNICLMKKNFLGAVDFYSKAYALNGSLHLLSGIGVSLAQKGDFQEAYDIACICSAFNVNFAAKIFTYLKPEFVRNAVYKGEQILLKQKKTELKADQIEIEREKDSPSKASLEPADISKRVVKTSAPPAPPKPDRIQFESNIPESYYDKNKTSSLSEDEKRGFISRAFSLCSRLEEEYNKKIYFNFEGLSDMERDLRLFFIQKNINPSQLTERVKDAGAFICYILKERYKARLIELKDFDEWAWPCVISRGEREIITYPVARVWNLIWHNGLPDQGWSLKYLQYISEELASGGSNYYGINAVKGKVRSHPEKLFDASIEHKRIFTLAQTLEEFSDIEVARTGVTKIDREIKKRFKPEIPPTADGWRLLRCYAHVLAEILIKDFKAEWFNAERSDGFWSLELPWKTYIFPIGKTFKAASGGENLAVFYDNLMAEKLQQGKLQS